MVKSLIATKSNSLLFEVVFTNQIFYYTCCNTLKCVTSWQSPSPRHCARATQLLLKKYRNGGERLATLVSDLTGPEFEPQTSCSRDEPITARPTDQLSCFYDLKNVRHLVHVKINAKQCSSKGTIDRNPANIYCFM